MNSKFQGLKTFLAATLVFFAASPAFAEEDSESFTHWDEIVRGLRSNAQEIPAAPSEEGYNMDDIQIQAGVGASFSYINLVGDPNYAASGLLKGVSLQFGIDLFHPEIQAEGTFRNFTSESLSKTTKAQARDFELRLVHSKRLSHGTRFRVGTGLMARYLDVSSRDSSGQSIHKQDSSPSALFLLGVGRQFGRSLFLGPDLSYRTSLSRESLDQNSVDVHFKVNAVF
ncbi:MAG: hypothetical protein CL676_07045 [Bdellovibrionaceae bacterium]|nr:hypothetical protein [Pseudobdellovibrionaceae bacterium]|tara:strand:+ start:339 stop:1019 length:681 start_codon:yes stop_codon:yes gene_type:complete